MSKYTIRFHRKVTKFLLLHPEIASRLKEIVPTLEENPYSQALDIKRLSGTEYGIFRLRIQKYRFIFRVHDQELEILFSDAGSRGQIYK